MEVKILVYYTQMVSSTFTTYQCWVPKKSSAITFKDLFIYLLNGRISQQRFWKTTTVALRFRAQIVVVFINIIFTDLKNW